MKSQTLPLLAVAALFGGIAAYTVFGNAKPDPAGLADVIYTNGKIYTVDEDNPWAEAVAIKDGKFIAVGSGAKVEAAKGDGTEVIDLGGKFVMPGIFDLHAHPFITPWYGSMNLTLENPGDPEKILEEVKAYAEAHPEKKWILAGQWHVGIYPEDAPKKEWLDEIVPDRPVVLLDQSGHTSWLNSKALELSGITKDTPTDHLFVIVKDPETGEPTGTIRELGLQLAERVIPQASPEEYAKPIEEIFEMFVSYGITSQQTAEGHKAPLDAMTMLEKEGRLHQRVFVSWDWRTTLNLAYTLEDIEEQIRGRAKYESDRIIPNYVKIFGDGSPGARTSLLLSPYEGEPGFLGQANMKPDGFGEAFAKFDKMGVGVHVHAIGEGTIRSVIEGFEAMKKANGESGVLHKIAHNWMITPEDIARVAKLKNVNIDFSPHIPYPHPGVAATYPPRIGKRRYANMFPARSAIEAGIEVGQGADWMTANPTPNPFPAMEGFITRTNPEHPELGQLNPKEAITLEQALHMFTLGGSRVIGAGDKLGSIEAGKHADFIVLDRNLFEQKKDGKVDGIAETQVLKTVLDGEVVYDRLKDGNEDVSPDEFQRRF